MNRLLIRLWGVLEGEDPESINYQIAQTLVTNIATIKHTSSAALADLCSVSKPSISRFCKNLGYDDFYDFRAELNQYCPDRGMKYLLSNRETKDETNWMDQYINGVRDNLELLQTPELQAKIEALVQDIKRFPNVYLMGNMQSGNTASNLRYNLHVVKKNIHSVNSLKEQTHILQHGKQDSLIVIFSVSGEYFRALFSGGVIPKQPARTKIWLVTTNPAVNRMEGVDEILNCKTGSDLAGANICLEMAANLIAFGYWHSDQT